MSALQIAQLCCLLEWYGTFSGFSGGRRGCETTALSFTRIVWNLHLGKLSTRFIAMAGELVVDDARLILKSYNFRLIEQLNLSLKSKEAIIQHLEEEKSQSGSYDGNLPAEKIRELTIALRHEKDSEIEVRKLTEQLYVINLMWYRILKDLCMMLCE